jgi:hypothetical protein
MLGVANKVLRQKMEMLKMAELEHNYVARLERRRRK